MWVAAFFVCFLLLAFAIPAGWGLARVWRRARIPREVICPESAASALIGLNARYAVKQHAIGDTGLRVANCSRWPEHRDCGQECLVQVSGV